MSSENVPTLLRFKDLRERNIAMTHRPCVRDVAIGIANKRTQPRRRQR